MKTKIIKKYKLKKWVRFVLSILVLSLSMLIYTYIGEFGKTQQENNMYLLINICSWVWLFIGQFIVYDLIWREN